MSGTRAGAFEASCRKSIDRERERSSSAAPGGSTGTGAAISIRTAFPSRWFDFYGERFDTVEINNSFYRLPEPSTFDLWRERAPAGFLYAVKASRYLTHNKKLKDLEEPVARFFGRARRLSETLGPTLYHLPPKWSLNLERLEAFLELLPRGVRHVFEFCEPSWYAEPFFAALERHGAALCLHDMPGSTPERRVGGPFVYVRFHGFGSRYGGRSDERLADWANWLRDRRREGRDVFAYFNNDSGGHAPRDAIRLRTMLDGKPAAVRSG
ncbi:MAG: DUF72 domain-containing protein [Acidobacteriota bacterium]